MQVAYQENLKKDSNSNEMLVTYNIYHEFLEFTDFSWMFKNI